MKLDLKIKRAYLRRGGKNGRVTGFNPGALHLILEIDKDNDIGLDDLTLSLRNGEVKTARVEIR